MTLEALHIYSRSKAEWMSEIVAYLQNLEKYEENEAMRSLEKKFAHFFLNNGVLYNKGFSQQYLRCLVEDEAKAVLREIHEGSYGNHLGGRSLAQKVLRQGYF